MRDLDELREEIAQCIEMVRTGKKPIATGLDGLWSAGLCLVAEESIRQKKQYKVTSVAAYWLKYQHKREAHCRFDVVSITWNGSRQTKPEIKHFIEAFDAQGPWRI